MGRCRGSGQAGQPAYAHAQWRYLVFGIRAAANTLRASSLYPLLFFFFFPRPPEVSASGVTGVGQGGGPPLLCPAYLPHPVGVTGAGLPGHTSAIHTRSVRGLSTEGLESRVS